MKLAALVGQLPHAADHRGCTGAALRGGIGIQTLVGLTPESPRPPASCLHCKVRLWLPRIASQPPPVREEGGGRCSTGTTTEKLGRISLLLLYQVWGHFGEHPPSLLLSIKARSSPCNNTVIKSVSGTRYFLFFPRVRPPSSSIHL